MREGLHLGHDGGDVVGPASRVGQLDQLGGTPRAWLARLQHALNRLVRHVFVQPVRAHQQYSTRADVDFADIRHRAIDARAQRIPQDVLQLLGWLDGSR